MTDYKQVYLASSDAYRAGDIDEMLSYATDDFSWFNLGPDGFVQLCDTKEKAAMGMQFILDNPDYLDGHVDFAKAFGNVVVVVETDTMRKDGAEVKQRRMSVYECRDGKLSRCISLPIAENEADGASA